MRRAPRTARLGKLCLAGIGPLRARRFPRPTPARARSGVRPERPKPPSARAGRARIARVARRQTGPRNERRRDARLRLSAHAARRASLYKRRPQRCDFSKIFECVFCARRSPTGASASRGRGAPVIGTTEPVLWSLAACVIGSHSSSPCDANPRQNGGSAEAACGEQAQV